MSAIDVFISHSSVDAELARKLISLIRSALRLHSTSIRCTSVDGYRLEGGANTNDQLRAEVHDSRIFIGLVSEASVKSSYVLFELGARWGAEKCLVPLLAPGVSSNVLPSPIAGVNALCCESRSQLCQLVEELGKSLEITPENSSVYLNELEDVLHHTSTVTSEVDSSPAVEEYKMVETPGGAVVYQYQGEPIHYCCPSCYGKNEIHPLQDRRVMTGLYDCPGCGAAYPVKASTAAEAFRRLNK